MKLLLLVVSLIFSTCQCRVAYKEAEVDSGSLTPNVKERAPLVLDCKYVTLSNERVTSTIVKWHGSNVKLTRGPENDVIIEENFKYTPPSVSYPSSSGLSGGGSSKTAKDPFADAPIVADDYTNNDIVNWYKEKC